MPRDSDKRVDEEGGERRRLKSAVLPHTRRPPKAVPRSSSALVPARPLKRNLRAGARGAFRYQLGALRYEYNPAYPQEVAKKGRERFMRRDLSGRDYVYVWVDGIHTKVRSGQDERLCCLAMVGVRLDGTKELVVFQDGYGNLLRAGRSCCCGTA